MQPQHETIKHWRSFGAAEWGHVKSGLVGLMLGSLVPVLLFYYTFKTFGFSPAVVVVLTWSAAIFSLHLRRAHGADVFSASTFGFACVKATAGLVSQDTMLYLAWPSVENLIYGTAFFGSALLGKPLLALYAERLYPIPATVRASSAFHRAFVIASGAWLCGHSLRAVLRLWLLATLPLELYLITDTVAGWPINIVLISFTTWYPLRQLRKAGFMTPTPLPISSLDAADLVVEEAGPTTV